MLQRPCDTSSEHRLEVLGYKRLRGGPKLAKYPYLCSLHQKTSRPVRCRCLGNGVRPPFAGCHLPMGVAAGTTVFATILRTRWASPSGPSSTPMSVLNGRTRPPTGICTVTLEDYFQAAALRPWIKTETWYRFESRLVASTKRTLELLASCGARATFFAGSDVVASRPGLLREIASHGHELAVSGDPSIAPSKLRQGKACEELRRRRETLEQVSGRQVYGYRQASDWLRTEDLWLLETLAEAGYAYDSSIRPAFRANPLAFLHNGTHDAGSSNGTRDAGGSNGTPDAGGSNGFREVALSSVRFCGMEIPLAGGAVLRLLPEVLIREALVRRDRYSPSPYVVCLRPWELDPDQPRINGVSAVVRLRQYRNLERMSATYRRVLADRPFGSVAGYLGFVESTVASNRASIEYDSPLPSPVVHSTRRDQPSKPVTLVVPCYNETPSLAYLGNTLQSLQAAYEGEYEFRFLFVDDGSTDGTWTTLQKLFGDRTDCTLVKHESNRGVAAAIQTGLRLATTDIVCSMDCDCTYDPHELGRMIPLLADGVDIVTASPYHPAGSVRNVPGWRLLLSKTLSRLYRLVLRQKLFTYTSCFRVYRRESTTQLGVLRPGFLGIAEMIGQLDLAGCRVVEYPTTLERRVLGYSKMKILRTVIGHTSLLLHLARARLGGHRPAVKEAWG